MFSALGRRRRDTQRTHKMLARLICFLIGHVFDGREVLVSQQPHIYMSRGRCARCGIPVFEMRDLRDEEDD